MAKDYDGWIVKNKWGSFLMWTFCETKSETIRKVNWKAWKKAGHKIVKVNVKFMEMK